MGAIGLDYQAVFKVAEILGYEVDELLLRRIRALEEAELSELSKSQEEDLK